MAWGNKKKRELEYQKSGQAAALKVGDLGALEVYGDDDDDFKVSWELEDGEFKNTDFELGSLEPDSQP